MKRDLQSPFSSRQYMLSRDYEIYYYNDQSLEKVDAHSHAYFEFYLFMEGSVTMEIGEKRHVLRPGDLVLVPPGLMHRAVIGGQGKPYRRIVFWVGEACFGRIRKERPSCGYLARRAGEDGEYVFHTEPAVFASLTARVFQLIGEAHGDRYARDELMELYVAELVLALNRAVYEQEQPKYGKEKRTLHQELMDYIEEHLDEDLSLDRLAGIFYVSKYYIAHNFRDNLGYPIHTYITKKRLAACRDAIAGQKNIGEVYLQYGFGDYSSFFRAFKKEYGMAPKAFQEQIRKMQREGVHTQLFLV